MNIRNIRNIGNKKYFMSNNLKEKHKMRHLKFKILKNIDLKYYKCLNKC